MLFAAADAWRVRRDTNTDTPLPADEPAGENPPNGAIVDYDLPRDAHGPVLLEVMDGEGKIVRLYGSEDPMAPTAEELRNGLIPPMWSQSEGPLPTSAGMHRWVWDLRATPPTVTSHEYPIAAVPHRTPLEPQGPLVAPGTYTVRLTAGGHSESAPLVVKMDPRVQTSVDDLKALYATQTMMAASLDTLAKADLAAHSVREQLDAPENAAHAAQFESFKAKLRTLLDGTGAAAEKRTPGIDDVTAEATELYGELQQVDSAPTAALLAASAHQEEEAQRVLPGWEEFKQKDLPALNLKLSSFHRPPIDLERQPEDMPQSGDED
jgi:hypothetical protein